MKKSEHIKAVIINVEFLKHNISDTATPYEKETIDKVLSLLQTLVISDKH